MRRFLAEPSVEGGVTFDGTEDVVIGLECSLCMVLCIEPLAGLCDVPGCEEDGMAFGAVADVRFLIGIEPGGKWLVSIFSGTAPSDGNRGTGFWFVILVEIGMAGDWVRLPDEASSHPPGWDPSV